jgi:hypothetical protein
LCWIPVVVIRAGDVIRRVLIPSRCESDVLAVFFGIVFLLDFSSPSRKYNKSEFTGINNTGWYTTLDGVIGGEDVPYLG